MEEDFLHAGDGAVGDRAAMATAVRVAMHAENGPKREEGVPYFNERACVGNTREYSAATPPTTLDRLHRLCPPPRTKMVHWLLRV